MNLGFILKLMSDRRRFIAIAALLSVVVIIALASFSSAWNSRSAGLGVPSSHTEGTIDREHSPYIMLSRDIFDDSEIAAARAAGLLEIAIRDPAQPGPQPLESMKRIPGETRFGETRFLGPQILRFHPAQRLPASTAFVLLLSCLLYTSPSPRD